MNTNIGRRKLKGKRLSILIILLSGLNLIAQETIDLKGEWQVKLDPENEWAQNDQGNCKSEGAIVLPGSLAENGFGYKTKGPDFGILTPEYKYIGKAGYSRKINIPKNWKNKQTTLFLERVLWGSQVLIDGKEISFQDALGTPHVHKLGKQSIKTAIPIKRIDTSTMNSYILDAQKFFTGFCNGKDISVLNICISEIINNVLHKAR